MKYYCLMGRGRYTIMNPEAFVILVLIFVFLILKTKSR
jgi:uncharacterized membrane protein